LEPHALPPRLRDCPSTEELTAFSEGGLPVPRLVAIAAHLDRCEACAAFVRAAEGRDTALGARLRALTDSDPYLCEAPCARLAARARAIPHEPATAALRKPAAAVAPPRRLGQYELLGLIGRGGMGTVYRVRHLLLNRVFALKILPQARLGESQALARFLREIRALGALDHPNVIRATDAGEADGAPFLVMEYVDGLDLARVVRLAGPLAVADACAAVRQAALGLQYAHERGLVHRDIKPSNLMLTPRGEVKILDLGLALLWGEHFAEEELTASNQFMGTPQFAAPEQAVAAHAVDIRADLYSLGCTLFKLLTGTAPAAGAVAAAVPPRSQGQVRKAVRDLRGQRPDVPAELGDVLEKLLAQDPADRYALPAQVCQALAPLARGSDLPSLFLAVRARCPEDTPDALPVAPETNSGMALATDSSSAGGLPPTSAQGGAARGRRRRALALAALVLVLGAGAALVWALSGGAEPRPRPEPPGGWPPNLSPALLEWPKAPPQTFWFLDPKEGAVKVSAEKKALLSLGATDGDDYTFAVDVEPQNTKHLGGVGVFFGHHDETFERSVGKKYQILALILSTDGGRQVWQLKRWVVTLQNSQTEKSVKPIYTKTMDRPGPKANRLTIVVRAGQLFRVRWNGKDLPDLADPPNRKPLHTVPGTDCRGAFGLYTTHSAGVFQHPVFSREER
jgi:serine/threonine protein kinase